MMSESIELDKDSEEVMRLDRVSNQIISSTEKDVSLRDITCSKTSESDPEKSIVAHSRITSEESRSLITAHGYAPHKMSQLKSSKGTEQLSTLPYVEPSWSGKPPDSYKFEVIKGGILLSTVDLSEKPYTVFGRLAVCDVMLEHPSVSRYQAIVQYCAKDNSERRKGFYVYDLGSTHGTFLNKQQIKPEIYHRLHVGHVLKFGGSSRLFALQGPKEDEETESDLTVTQIKAAHTLMKQNLQDEHEKQEVANNLIDEGVDWGMGEDAAEEISTENPFALSTCNEELYLDDPKKTLRGWFEREGCELEYDVEEKGFSHFLCRVELPIDSPTGEAVYAEASVKGKKKEAVVACALEACRILDRYGLLRQSHHESHKRKQKNWEENDFYDSDEDTYLDRTGTIEKKREMRRKILKKDSTVETFDSLVQKLKTVEEEMHDIDKKLQAADQHASSEKIEEADLDTLDAYMSSLEANTKLDKKTKSKLKLQLAQLQQEQRRLKKMINIARPTSLPALSIAKHPSLLKKDYSSSSTRKQMPLIGAMKGYQLGKFKKQLMLKPQVQHQTSSPADAMEEEEEEEEDEDIDKKKYQFSSIKESGEFSHLETLPEITATVSKPEESKQVARTVETIKGPEQPKRSPSTRNSRKASTPKKVIMSITDNEQCEYDDSNPDYAMWLPPVDQSGDGYTHLNAKFGY